jgi:hypothetical protein
VNAEFEEKEYEIALYLQLADGSPYIWSPGQVLEKQLGLDGTQFTSNATLWKILGQHPLPGINLNSPGIRRNIRRRLPSFRCNLLLQVKRPVYLVRHVRGYLGTVPYYRFEINQDQQSTLQTLANKVGKHAYIGYACPAFSTTAELYRAIVSSSIVSSSNFCKVNRLSGHQFWAYVRSGTSGYALSDPEYIQETPFLESLGSMAQIDVEYKQQSRFDFLEQRENELHRFAMLIEDTCEERSSKDDYASWALERIRELESAISVDLNDSDYFVHQAIRDYTSVQIFCNTFNSMWFTIG